MKDKVIKIIDLKQLFIDPSENEVAILGGGYLQNFIRDGSLGTII